jgi:putative membrane protein
MFYMHDIGWGWWLMMSIGMVAFWALLVYGLVWLLRGDRGQQREAVPEQGPDEILKRRLAAGEITIAQYENLREALDERPREPAAA